MRKIAFILVVSLIVSSCKKDSESFGDTPEIGFNRIYPAQVKEYVDKFYIEIAYKDGNGDLGSANPDSSNITVTDTRSNLEYGFRLRDLSTPNGDPNIKGTLIIEMPPTAILDSANTTENTTFTVVVEDQKGNLSNKVETGRLTITR